MTWEERRTQEKINKWVREGRGKEMKDIKIGKSRIRIKRIWKAWEEIEREEREKKERKKEKKREEKIRGINRREKETSENFV